MNASGICKWTVVLLIWGGLIAAPLPAADDDLPKSIRDLQPIANDGLPIASDFEEVPAPFVPAKPRSAEDEAHITALALFAAARSMQNEGDDAEALRLYQRALRYDPVAVPVLEQIIPLALKLKRPGEAVRYALRAAELQPANPLLLKQLGLHLTEQNDHEGAIRLYEKALELEGGKPKRNPSSVLLRLEMGRLYFLTEQYEKSAEAFDVVYDALGAPEKYGLSDNTVSTMLGDGGETYAMFAESYFQAKQYEKAIDAFKKADALENDAPVLAYEIARVRLAQDKLDDAEKQLNAYFESKSTREGDAAYELLAELLEKQKQKDKLTSRLEELAKADPDNLHLQRFLADQYHQQKQYDKAVTAFAKVLAGSAEDTKLATLRTLAVQQLADVRREQQDAQAFLDLLTKHADDEGTLDSLEDQLVDAARDQEFAESVLKLADQRLSKKELTYGGDLAAGHIALESGKYDETKKFFDAAIEAKPTATAELYLVWGLGLMVKEEYNRAVEVFERGIVTRSLPPENPAYYYYMAGALELAGRTDEAVKSAREAVRRAENNPRLQSRLAWILYHADRYEEAEAEYKKLVERFDDIRGSDEIRDSLLEARLILSNICVIQGKNREAEEWLEQVLDEFPENISALNDLGYLWADQNKNLERALEMVSKAVEAEPENDAYRDSLGWTLYRLGRYQDALPHLEKAAAVEAPDGVILDHLADIYIKLNQKDKAIDAWKRALDDLDPAREADRITQVREKLKAAGVQVPKPKKQKKNKAEDKKEESSDKPQDAK